ncbi:FG-GAP repeat domain-containing protein, partial [Viscerimonas tarda]
MKKYKFLLAAFIGCLFAVQTVDAAVIAKPDNIFVPPDSPTTTTYFDVLTNDYYGDDCILDRLIISIVEGPHIAGATVVVDNAAMHNIGYTPGPNGLVGTDWIEYKIECSSGGGSATAKVYINIADKPDAIFDAECYVKPEGIGFAMSQMAISTVNTVSDLTNILVGNIDNDNNTEIIVSGGSVNLRSTAIQIFEYNRSTNALGLEYSITGLGNADYAYRYALAKITGGPAANKKNTPSLFIARGDNSTLYRYDLNGSAFTSTWAKPYTAPAACDPFVTDLMGDGNQQVLVGNTIINASTGDILATATGTAPLHFGQYGHRVGSSATVWPSSPLPVDIDLDGKMEIIGGDCVYSVNLTNYSGTAGNSYTLLRRAVADAAHTNLSDGGVAIADMDLDGYPDVVIAGPNKGVYTTGTANGYVCVYNPRTGVVMHTNEIANIPRYTQSDGALGPSHPFVGDIDGDGYPEICVTGAYTLRVYDLDGGTTLTQKWALGTTDDSASTVLSVFDFTQDGQARLVYRDHDNLRIIRSNGSAAAIDATFSPVCSPTGNEYPVIADINGDGHAEIITTGSPTGNGTNGTLRIYGASGATKWAPARDIWNQIAYNPLYVNDDLTIPQHPISPATKFVAADGTITRPYNNFLQQSTLLSSEGKIATEGSDLTFKTGAPRIVGYDASGNLEVKVTIVNIGGAPFTGPIEFRVYSYKGDPPVYTLLAPNPMFTDANASGLAAGDERDISFTIPQASLPTDGAFDNFAVTMNLTTAPDQTPVYSQLKECNEGYNNRTLGFSTLSGSTVLCQGNSGTLTVNPTGAYNVYWYDKDHNLLNPGDPKDTYPFGPKNSDLMEYMLLQAKTLFDGPIVSPMWDTIYVYRAADTLVWNNKVLNGDWLDERNWRNPDDPDNRYPMTHIPQECTSVYIPAGGGLNFPDLEETKILHPSETPIIKNIHFSFGSELKRPDLLEY